MGRDRPPECPGRAGGAGSAPEGAGMPRKGGRRGNGAGMAPGMPRKGQEARDRSPEWGGKGTGSRPGPEGLVGKKEEFGRVSVPSVLPSPPFLFPRRRLFKEGAARREGRRGESVPPELSRAQKGSRSGLRNPDRNGFFTGGNHEITTRFSIGSQ